MESPSQNNINAIREVRALFNKIRSNFSREKQRELEKNSIKRKLSTTF